MKFKDYLQEELKDPAFREVYEEISTEENRKLQEAIKAPDYLPAGYVARNGDARQWRYKDSERPTDASCCDCRLPYSAFADIVLPDDVWERITPAEHREGGILCANCIFERLHCIGIHKVMVA